MPPLFFWNPLKYLQSQHHFVAYKFVVCNGVFIDENEDKMVIFTLTKFCSHYVQHSLFLPCTIRCTCFFLKPEWFFRHPLRDWILQFAPFHSPGPGSFRGPRGV